MGARFILLFAAAASLGGALAACGLEVGGAAQGDDGGVTGDGSPPLDATFDGGGDGASDAIAADGGDGGIPPTCATVDASCLGAPVPRGWSLAGIQAGSVGCPASFDKIAFVTNPRLHADSCRCSACATQGSYTCDGFTLAFGNMCNGSSITGTMSPKCVAQSATGNGAHVSGTPAAPAGSVTCSNTENGTHAVDTNPVTACRPNRCDADYCGLRAKGMQTCIVHDGDVPCPTGFSLGAPMGTSATAVCDGCAGCTLAPAVCTGKIRVFDNVTDCNGNGSASGPSFKGEFNADGTCQNPNSNFDSIYYIADRPPAPSCTPATAYNQTGSGQLVAPQTVCCVP